MRHYTWQTAATTVQMSLKDSEPKDWPREMVLVSVPTSSTYRLIASSSSNDSLFKNTYNMKLYVHHTTQKNQAKGLFNGIVAASLMLAPANVEPVHAQVFTAVAAKQTKTTSPFQEP